MTDKATHEINCNCFNCFGKKGLFKLEFDLICDKCINIGCDCINIFNNDSEYGEIKDFKNDI
jgi:hypothetical protein